MAANDPPMHDPGDEAKAVLPAGLACEGCGYDVAGLALGGVCPECGRALPESWPVWRLAACDRAYVERVRDEFGMLRWVALTACVVFGATLVGSVLGRQFYRWDSLDVLVLGSALVAVGAAAVLPLIVAYALRALWLHPRTSLSAGVARRRRLRWALGVAEVGIALVWGWIGIGCMSYRGAGGGWLVVALALAVGGLGWASIEAMGYGGQTLRRAGMEHTGDGLLPGWGFALVVLALAAIGWAMIGIDASLALGVLAGAALGPTTALAVRCHRVEARVGAIAREQD